MRKGFTLIELLVCVAVIALLIAILLPSLAAARAQAQSTACLAKLHAYGVALGEYASDSNGDLPSYYYDVPLLLYMTDSDPMASSAPAQAYINYGRCPSCLMPITNQFGLTYSGNGNAFLTNGANQKNYRLQSMTRPAEQICFGDGNQNFSDGGTWKVFDWSTFQTVTQANIILTPTMPSFFANYDYPSGAGVTGLRYRHGLDPSPTRGWANVIYFDAHAEPMKMGQMRYRNVAVTY